MPRSRLRPSVRSTPNSAERAGTPWPWHQPRGTAARHRAHRPITGRRSAPGRDEHGRAPGQCPARTGSRERRHPTAPRRGNDAQTGPADRQRRRSAPPHPGVRGHGDGSAIRAPNLSRASRAGALPPGSRPSRRWARADPPARPGPGARILLLSPGGDRGNSVQASVRDRLLEAAASVFVERAFGGPGFKTSPARPAQHGALYSQFDSKSALLAEAWRPTESSRSLRSCGRPARRISLVSLGGPAREHVEWIGHPLDTLLLDAFAAASHDAEAARRLGPASTNSTPRSGSGSRRCAPAASSPTRSPTLRRRARRSGDPGHGGDARDSDALVGSHEASQLMRHLVRP